jgi:hypothetical protein
MKKSINLYKKNSKKILQSALLLFILLSSQIIFGQIAPVITPSGGFDIDGGLKANTPHNNVGDWFPGAGGTGGSVFDASANPINALMSGRNIDPFNSSDDIFTEGSKFNSYIGDLKWFTNSAPDKNDINNALYHVARDGSNNQWAFIAGDRLSTNGTSYIDFEFLQGTVTKNAGGTFTGTPLASKANGGGRTEGDMIVSMEYTNGGSKPLVYVYQWKLSGSKWSYQLATIANLSTNAFAETNRTGAETGLLYDAFGVGNRTYAQYAFVEAGINVTYLISQINAGNVCAGLSIKTLWVKTKASASSTAALKDFMEPIPVNFQFGTSSITGVGPFCINASAVQLVASPSGGEFSGHGVTTGGLFTPSSAGTGTHTITYTSSGCTSTTDIVVNDRPAAPGVTVVNNCDGSSDLTATNFTGSLLWSNDATTTSIHVTNAATYTVTQTVNGCTSANGSGISAPKTTPTAPSVSYVAPLCTENTFKVNVTSVVANATYSIRDKAGNVISGVQPSGSYTPANAVDFSFTNIPAGSGFQVTVTNSGCPSSVAGCGNNGNGRETLTTTTKSATLPVQAITLEEPLTKVTAAPNPFDNRIRFSLQSAVSGQGSLEIYDMLGQKLKTVFQGHVEKGQIKTIEYSVPGSQHSNLIYLFKVGNERKSGILIGVK